MTAPAPVASLIAALAAQRRGDTAQVRALCDAHAGWADFRHLAAALDRPAPLPRAIRLGGGPSGGPGGGPGGAIPAVPDGDTGTGADAEALDFAWEHHAGGRLLLAWLGYASVLTGNPTHREALSTFGILRMQLGDLPGSIATLARTADIHGMDAELESKFGVVAANAAKSLTDLVRTSGDALTAFGRLAPRFRHTRGIHQQIALLAGRAAVQRLKIPDLKDAARLGRMAIALDPQVLEFYCNLGYALEMDGHYRAAAGPYRHGALVAADRSKQAYAYLMLMHLCFRLGQWDRFRSLLPHKYDYAPLSWWKDFHPAPVWDGTLQPGASILIHGESGFGDVIQCIRYADYFSRHGMAVHVVCDRRLKSLCRLVAGVDAVYSLDQPVPQTDFRALSFDLFYTLEHDPRRTFGSAPYIDVSRGGCPGPTLQRRGGETLIGIKWTTTDPAKDLPLDAFARLRLHPGVRFISLQPEPPDAGSTLEVERPLDGCFEDAEDSFLTTAHVIDQLDLVITADSVIAHLAGAVGTDTWVALKAVPDWRWLVDRDDSPIYDAVTLFRQPVGADGWTSVFDALETALRTRLGL